MAQAKNPHKYVSVSKYVEFDVDIHLGDIDTEDLIEELKLRGITVQETDCELDDIYKQFAFGREQEGVRLMKMYIENVTGKTL